MNIYAGHGSQMFVVAVLMALASALAWGVILWLVK